jgi:3-oxoacyl-[acyl-carrier protein] reductase
MTDLLARVARNRTARRVISALELPLPLPAVLERGHGPWTRRELDGRAVGLIGFGNPTVAEPIARMLAEAAAHAHLVGVNGARAAFDAAGEAFAIPPVTDSEAPLDGLVIDATAHVTPSGLAEVHADLHRLVRRLNSCARVVVLARPAGTDPLAAATSMALEGLVRSTAKELGRRGTTAQLITIERGAEASAAAILRFILSRRSAFVTAQPLRATPTTGSLEYVGSLDGKVALVTGAARGIGEQVARRLADEGAHVICVDRPADEAALASVANSIRGTLLVADVRDTARIVEAVRARHRAVDIIVHNAGITRDRMLVNLKPEDWKQVLDINLIAVTDLTTALPLADGGRVICLSSVAGIAGNVGQTSYAASKAGLIGYVRALSAQLAPRKITVNAVAPGFIETRMTAAIPLMIREAGRRLSALGQGGDPVDVAEVITFLSQPAGAGITGSVVRVCGGALIGA